MVCCYCGCAGDLRPYGPKGAMVCFPCATSSPEREAEAKQNFGAQLAACGDAAAIDGSHVGPYPAERRMDAAHEH